MTKNISMKYQVIEKSNNLFNLLKWWMLGNSSGSLIYESDDLESCICLMERYKKVNNHIALYLRSILIDEVDE